ncbi:MAG: hypothetical protein KAR64_04090 [Thermoplasmatales archaeon]|nr:hypothetical protein [Thermoplasmatales archaeon]
MNKKLLVVSILAVLMLVAISFSTAVSSNTTTTVKKKESPLFDIRARRAINEKFGEVIENIKTKYIGERVFYSPIFMILKNKQQTLLYTFGECPTFYGPTCGK